jgi:hypothetical protein
MNCYLINSSDGQKFAVGCECVRKTGDAGLVKKADALKRRQARIDRAAKRQEAYLRELENQREANGGFTDGEFVDAKREDRVREEERKRERRINILQGLAARMRDGKGRFRDSIAASLSEGILPFGRGWDLTCEILAKQEGRIGSKAFDAEYNKIEAIFEEAENIK